MFCIFCNALLPLFLRFLFIVRWWGWRRTLCLGCLSVKRKQQQQCLWLIVNLEINNLLNSKYGPSAYLFPSSTSESELSDDDDEDEPEEDEEEEELELLLLLVFLFAFSSFPFTALSFLTVWSDGWWSAGGDSFLFEPCDECLVSVWLPTGDLLEFTSECLDSDWGPLLSGGLAWYESLKEPCDDEGRFFCTLSSLFLSSWSVFLSLSVGVFMSCLSRTGEGEEEELEEEEDLPGWGISFGYRGSFSLTLSCCTSLCLNLSSSLSLEKDRLLLLLRCGLGDRLDLNKILQTITHSWFCNNLYMHLFFCLTW